MKGLPGAVLLALAVLAGPAAARECGEGRVGGGPSVSGDALENFECALLARVFCRVAEDRDAGVSAGVSIQRTTDWLQRLNATGSHQKAHWRPFAELAAQDVYRDRERKPGPMYYRTAYSCGLGKRLGDDPQAQQRLGQAFAEAADRCEREHALAGKRTYPNRPLRECLARAVDQLAPARP